MSKRILCILLFLGLSASLLFAFEFGYPVDGNPWYYLKLEYPTKPEMKGGSWEVSRVFVNSVQIRDILVLQNGRELVATEVSGNSPFTIKARLSWERGKKYIVRVDLKNTKTGKPVSLEQQATSPSLHGYWNPDWKNYLSLLIFEENGVERINYPVHVTVGLLSKYLRSPDEIRIVRAEKKEGDVIYKEIPSQVYDLVKWEDKEILSIEEKDIKTGKPITRYHPTTSLSIAFLANLKPNEKATYLVFYNNSSAPKSSYTTDLKVEGKGLGKTIENNFYKVVLAEKSGMINEIFEKSTNTKLEHKLETNGAIHWNPDAYSPPHAWSHVSDWENPPFSDETGPIFYSLRREAPLPHVKDILVSVTYYFYANTPYFLVESVMEAGKDLFVQALRDGEIVFNKEVFNKVAYKTMDDQVKTIDFAASRKHPNHVITLRPDTPWVTLFNAEKGIAFSNLYLDLSLPNLHGRSASQQQPYIYIQHGPWYYIARAFVYSFGSNNQTRMLPVKAGSTYYERNAWLPFSLKESQDYASYPDKFFRMLKHPLNILESMETYPESPEGWVVPILTEPFEEGVKDAVGEIKKK